MELSLKTIMKIIGRVYPGSRFTIFQDLQSVIVSGDRRGDLYRFSSIEHLNKWAIEKALPSEVGIGGIEL